MKRPLELIRRILGRDRSPRPIVRRLNGFEKEALAACIPGEDLDGAVIHIGDMPWYAPKWASDITRGKDIYFAPDVYDGFLLRSLSLLGHELAHVGQYRLGMRWCTYLWSCVGGYRNSMYELPAFAMGEQISGKLDAAIAPGYGRTPKNLAQR